MSLPVLFLALFLVLACLVAAILYPALVGSSRRKYTMRRLDALRSPGAAAGILDLQHSDAQSVLLFDDWIRRNRFLSHLEILVEQSGAVVSLQRLALTSGMLFVFVFAVLSVFGAGLLYALIGGCLLASVPALFIVFKRKRRFKKFEELFPEAIDLMVRSIRAGHPFQTALELVAEEMPDPVSEEFKQVYDEQKIGVPMREALDNLTLRVPLADVRLFVSALQVQRQTGGNLVEILGCLTSAIRDRFKVARQIQVFTAEGKMSLAVLMGLPPATGLLMYLSSPDYFAGLLHDPTGQKLLALAGFFQFVGFLCIRRMIRIEI